MNAMTGRFLLEHQTKILGGGAKGGALKTAQMNYAADASFGSDDAVVNYGLFNITTS